MSDVSLPKRPKAKAKRKPGRPRIERTQHIVEIERWDWDYMFMIDETKFRTEPYFDCRQLNITGQLIKPKSSRDTQVEVTFFPTQSLSESERKSHEPKSVGHITHRGKDYRANLHMPADILGPVLQMLIAKRYRFIFLTAEKSFRGESSVRGYRLSESIDDEDVSFGA